MGGGEAEVVVEPGNSGPGGHGCRDRGTEPPTCGMPAADSDPVPDLTLWKDLSS